MVAGAGAVAIGGLAFVVLLAALAAATRSLGRGGAPSSSPASAAPAVADIPGSYLRLYVAAGQAYGVDWAVLAAVGEVECDHGRDPDPSCTRLGAVNGAGAGGPMQFLAATWAAYGVDGDGDGHADRWNAADAIFAAANYLRASGVRADPCGHIRLQPRGAVRGDRQAWARRYRAALSLQSVAPALAAHDSGPGLEWLAARTSTPVVGIAGSRAALAPGNSHIASSPCRRPR